MTPWKWLLAELLIVAWVMGASYFGRVYEVTRAQNPKSRINIGLNFWQGLIVLLPASVLIDVVSWSVSLGFVFMALFRGAHMVAWGAQLLHAAPQNLPSFLVRGRGKPLLVGGLAMLLPVVALFVYLVVVYLVPILRVAPK
ncbi:MAG: hypothetical protein P9L99_07530 [Candidatus Lernaella stagnicola]|nr:hypothetical protein [Candidatus Lernaella stagnicola]